MGIGVGRPQGQRLERKPGQGRFEAISVGRTDVAVEGLERPGRDPIPAEIVLRVQVEQSDVIAQGLADRAPGPDLLAARRGRDELGVVAAEGEGIVDELLGPGRKEARAPAGVEAEIGDRVPGDAEPPRRPLVGDVAGEVDPAGLEMVGELVGDPVVADARGDAPVGADLEPVEDEDAGAGLGQRLVGDEIRAFDGVAEVGVFRFVDGLPGDSPRRRSDGS